MRYSASNVTTHERLKSARDGMPRRHRMKVTNAVQPIAPGANPDRMERLQGTYQRREWEACPTTGNYETLNKF